MAISRPVLLALLGAVLFGATALAVQNARTGSDSDATPAAVQTDPAPAGTQPSANSTPQQTLAQAFNLGSVQSGKFAVRLRLADRDQRTAGQPRRRVPEGRPGRPARLRAPRPARRRASDRAGRLPLAGRQGLLHQGRDGLARAARDLGPARPTASPSAAPRARCSRSIPRPGSARSSPRARPPSTALRPTTCPPPWTRRPSSRTSLRRPRPTASTRLRSPAQACRASVKRAAARRVGGRRRPHRAPRRRRRPGSPATRAWRSTCASADVNKPQQIEAPEHVRAGAPGGVLGRFANGLVRGASGGTSLEALHQPQPGPRRASRPQAQEGRDSLPQPARAGRQGDVSRSCATSTGARRRWC